MRIIRRLGALLVAVAVLGLTMRAIVSMRDDWAPWSNYYGAPVTPLAALLMIAVGVLTYLLSGATYGSARPLGPAEAGHY